MKKNIQLFFILLLIIIMSFSMSGCIVFLPNKLPSETPSSKDEVISEEKEESGLSIEKEETDVNEEFEENEDSDIEFEKVF